VLDDRHLVSMNIDLFPTLCDFAGVEPPSGLPGLSLRPMIEQGMSLDGVPTHPFVVSELNKSQGFANVGRMVRSLDYKYVVFKDGGKREQFFDLKNDPGEMVNLAGRDEHKAAMDRHRAMLLEWIDKVNDTFPPSSIPKPDLTYAQGAGPASTTRPPRLEIRGGTARIAGFRPGDTVRIHDARGALVTGREPSTGTFPLRELPPGNYTFSLERLGRTVLRTVRSVW
jgi:hypothetical protein